MVVIEYFYHQEQLEELLLTLETFRTGSWRMLIIIFINHHDRRSIKVGHRELMKHHLFQRLGLVLVVDELEDLLLTSFIEMLFKI